MASSLEKFSSQMDSALLRQLRDYTRNSNHRMSDVLNAAVEEYLQRIAIRPSFRKAAEDVLNENSELLDRLAK